MPFNSYEFILVFAPLSVVGFIALRRRVGPNAAGLWLVLVSALFYGWGRSPQVAILLGSAIFNYAVSHLIDRARRADRSPRALLTLGISGNVAALAYFKYVNFFIDNVNLALGQAMPHLAVALPLGISFLTFVQIAYLVDVYSGREQPADLLRYAVFVTFFPKLIAGPITRLRDMTPVAGGTGGTDSLAIGLSFFAIGLAKKVVLADSIAPHVDAVFAAAARGAELGVADAWFGPLGYALQLYFDFSGYSDMAVGLGYMFGFRLPFNFAAPLRATSISEFWRRWHMTLTRFITELLHAPLALALTRSAVKRRLTSGPRFTVTVAGPIVVTFLLAGLWHGAGWTFIVFGLVHGLGLAIAAAWRWARWPSPPPVLGWGLTMAVALLGFVFFRADTIATATQLLQAMAGPGWLAPSGASIDLASLWPWVLAAALGAIALVGPTTQGLILGVPSAREGGQRAGSAWQPSVAWAIGCAALLLAGLALTAGTPFVYYQF